MRGKMKKLRLSDSEKRLLLLLLALILFVGAYFIGFRRNVTAAEAIEKDNAEKSAMIAQLETMVNRQAEVEARTVEAKQNVEEITAKYPPAMTVEKAITVVQDMENATGIEVLDINFVMDNLLLDFSGMTAGTAENAEGGEAQEQTEQAAAPSNEPKGYYASLTMNYAAGYDSLKKLADYVPELQDRATIPAISAAYDSETGKLAGTMTVNLYYLTETGREYEEPKLSGIGKGVSDIFKSGVGRVVSSDSQESDSENDQEDTDDGTDADTDTETETDTN